MSANRALASERRIAEVTAEVMLVTPKMATEWLASHENVRPLSKKRVESLAHDMQTGNWKVTHQGICFDEHDKLIDGQHRLHAVVLSGASVRMLVCRSRGITIHDALDRGTPRRLATLTGRRTREIAAVGVLRFFEAGQVIHRPLTLGEAQDIFDHHDKAFEALAEVRGASRLIGGVLAACVWAHPCEPAKVVRFAEQVARGEMIKRGDPAYAFRSWQARPSGRRSHAENAGLAAANCLRYFLVGEQLASVFDGESGYRALTAQRRRHRLPHTPEAETVPGVALRPGHGETSRND